MDKLAKNNSEIPKADVDMKDLMGLHIEKQNPDNNTFVNFNDGATNNTKIAISYLSQENGDKTESGISYQGKEDGGVTTLSGNEEGGDAKTPKKPENEVKITPEDLKKILEESKAKGNKNLTPEKV